MEDKPKLIILCDVAQYSLQYETKAVRPPKIEKIAHISVRESDFAQI